VCLCQVCAGNHLASSVLTIWVWNSVLTNTVITAALKAHKAAAPEGTIAVGTITVAHSQAVAVPDATIAVAHRQAAAVPDATIGRCGTQPLHESA
jgi:hypothetical protein